VKSLDTPTLPFLPNFQWDFVRMDSLNIPAKFEARRDTEIIGGTQKNLGRLWIRPRSLFSNIFHGLVFGWTL